MNHAVKALIYRDDTRILLQQRDYNPGIVFQGYWTFFGGQVETGESLKDALKRELLEELEYSPGNVGEELFQWEWRGDNPFCCNHCLPVLMKADENTLVLKEGLAMKWFLFEELHEELPLVPGVYENLGKIKEFLDRTFSEKT
ncbi:NUDIX domain-containing protein [Leptospira ilyithenensis]|uniref:NUDIX domain-containing protein n=1 Tax=Leptospira ilyithenensis TaxID=2484901 RepID=A0A4R9LK73_9LEPT|nr:NUDIX domain-containing protein [Leptospira ilyithenensis]TGN07986.1 NUDIX domain-containing protein [Leptospira ilyithenensis]